MNTALNVHHRVHIDIFDTTFDKSRYGLLVLPDFVDDRFKLKIFRAAAAPGGMNLNKFFPTIFLRAFCRNLMLHLY